MEETTGMPVLFSGRASVIFFGAAAWLDAADEKYQRTIAAYCRYDKRD